MFIKLTGQAAKDRTQWLQLFTKKTGKKPTFRERTEAFFAARDGKIPNWATWKGV